MKKYLGLLFSSFLPLCLLHSPTQKTIDTPSSSSNSSKRYNLCVFLQFADETSWLDEEEYGKSRRDIIDETYNKSIYSYHDYFASVSNNKVDLEAVYLFPEATGFSPFMLSGTRESYAKRSETNPNGYELEGTANSLLQMDWSSAIQEALNNGIRPCSINDRSKTIPLEKLDQDNNGTIDSITLVLSPQQSTHYTVSWGEPLYPCKSQSSRISVSTTKGTIRSDTYIQYVCDFTSLCKENQTTDEIFLPNATGMHEMGHAFGLLDLYDYNRRYYPVGNMSLMSNLITPIPQFITSREREALGWLDDSNIKEISKSGTYELDPVTAENSGVVCYKMPLEGFENKWLYLEYRVFDDPTINRFDSKNRGLYTAAGTEIQGIAGKSGVLVYVVDVSNRFPTNSLGRPQYFGIDIYGGSQTNRTDAPRVTGDIVSIATYNSDGEHLSTDCVVEVIGFENGKAKVSVASPHLAERPAITEEGISNAALYESLLSLTSTDTLYENSLKDIKYLNLAFLDIENLDFLSLFSFDSLRYLVLSGNKITDPSPLIEFLEAYPNVKVMLDSNDIDLNSISDECLNLETVLYGLQNINASSGGSVTYVGPITYHINDSFSRGDYAIYYIGGNMPSTRSLGRGLQTLTIEDDGTYHFVCCYFFENQPALKYQYEFDIVRQTNHPSWSLSSEEGTYKVNEKFVLPLRAPDDPSGFNVVIFYDGSALSTDCASELSFDRPGTYLLQITIEDNVTHEIQTLTYTAHIKEIDPLHLSLDGPTSIITVSNAYLPAIYVSKGNDLPIRLTTQGMYGNISFSFELSNEARMENDEKRSTIYEYVYHVADDEGASDTLTLMVEVMDLEYLVNHQVSGISYVLHILDSNRNEVTTTKPGQTYTYEYVFTDEHSQTATYSKQVTFPKGDGESESTPNESSPNSSTPNESTPPETDADIEPSNTLSAYIIGAASGGAAILVISLAVILAIHERKKK